MLAYVFPGQGSQHVGMGKELFDRFPEKVGLADELLGYSMRELCLQNPEGRLNRTEYTQPALFVVNALSFYDALERTGRQPDMTAGHSLGEYNALLAAGVIDFRTGVTLVAERGRLMSRGEPGTGMAAVIGLDAERTASLLERNRLDRLDVANLNAPTQAVISGPLKEIEAAQAIFEEAGGRYIRLNVSAAFHSRCMQPAKERFAAFLRDFRFQPPRIPVFANVTARPYPADGAAALLAEQIVGSVRWVETVRRMMAEGATEFLELGPKHVLTELIRQIRPLGPLAETAVPPEPEPVAVTVTAAEAVATGKEVREAAAPPPAAAPIRPPHILPVPTAKAVPPAVSSVGRGIAGSLGSASFKADHGVGYAYVAGGLYHGISSVDLVVNMARRGFLASLGSFGLELSRVESAIVAVKAALPQGEPFAVNVFSNFTDPDGDRPLVGLCLKHGVRTIECSGYIRPTLALARFRLRGLHLRNGVPHASHRIIAKLSRPEIAAAFLRPVPERLVADLLEQGEITREQAELAQRIPAADDICLETDSGWYSERGNALSLFPAVSALRDEILREHRYAGTPRIGLAGGIGSPETVAGAYFAGADFVLTGTINQCTVEAGVSDIVKDLLQDCGPQDTIFAPGGELFEFGGQVQVLRKGLFFPMRAAKLYQQYQHFSSLNEIDPKTRSQLEEKYFGKSLDEVWRDIEASMAVRMPDELGRAERNPRHKMLLVFRSYFTRCIDAALMGRVEEKVQFNIPCSTAMGSLNHWLKGTPYQSWRNRPVAEISQLLLDAAVDFLRLRMGALGTAADAGRRPASVAG